MSLVHLATRIFNTPLAIHPEKLSTLLHVLGPRLGLRADMIPKAGDVVPGQRRDAGGGEPIGPVAMIPAVAMIPVYGTLVKRSSNVDAESGLTSYAALRSKVDAAMKSPIVKSLLFDMDSAGGEVSGLFDFCSYLGSVRGTKPMIGIANDMAFSAAYAVASCMEIGR